jgi:UDP-GlcNAc:undecaprenyl-phosphate GlcNAc-1-phosphate transferase
MGIPILVVLWSILRRILAGKNPFKTGDRKHLHFRLLDLGLGQRQAVLIYYLIASVFGLSALFLQSMGKILVLGVLFLFMILILILFYYLDKKKRNA